jgi:hypothetical protein
MQLRIAHSWVVGVILLRGATGQNSQGRQRRNGLFGEDYCGFLWHRKPHENLCCTLGHGTENVNPGHGGLKPVRIICINNKTKVIMNTINRQVNEEGEQTTHEVSN